MLNPRQQRFCQEYLIDLNATQAAIRAGYSVKTAQEQGCRLLTNVIVQEEISKGQEKQAKETGITAQWVLSRLVEVAERCMQRVPVMRFDRTEKEMIQVQDDKGRDIWEFDANGANRALELIGKHRGMFADKHEFTGKDGGDIHIKVTIGDAETDD